MLREVEDDLQKVIRGTKAKVKAKGGGGEGDSRDKETIEEVGACTLVHMLKMLGLLLLRVVVC